jgi:hypothetical protein
MSETANPYNMLSLDRGVSADDDIDDITVMQAITPSDSKGSTVTMSSSSSTLSSSYSSSSSSTSSSRHSSSNPNDQGRTKKVLPKQGKLKGTEEIKTKKQITNDKILDTELSKSIDSELMTNGMLLREQMIKDNHIPFIYVFNPIDPMLKCIMNLILINQVKIIERSNNTKNIPLSKKDRQLLSVCIMYLWMINNLSQDLAYKLWNHRLLPSKHLLITFEQKLYKISMSTTNIIQIQSNLLTVILFKPLSTIPAFNDYIPLEELKPGFDYNIHEDQLDKTDMMKIRNTLEMMKGRLEITSKNEPLYNIIRSCRNYLSHQVKFVSYYHERVIKRQCLMALLFITTLSELSDDIKMSIKSSLTLPLMNVNLLSYMVFNKRVYKNETSYTNLTIGDDDLMWISIIDSNEMMDSIEKYTKTLIEVSLEYIHTQK